MFLINRAFSEFHSLQRAQIFSTNAETIILSKVYKDFENLFLVKNACYLPSHKDHNDAINLVDSKQPFYGSIYSLSDNKLSIF